jgi:hypothetical protein
MSKKRHPDIRKYCPNCRKLLERKRFSGRIEDYSAYKKRKFCDQACYDEYRAKHSDDPPPTTMKDVEEAAEIENLTPLEFMLREMNRPTNSLSYRKEMAALAAPYVHAKLDSVKQGKKDERQARAAEVAKGGRFAQNAPPGKVVPIK